MDMIPGVPEGQVYPASHAAKLILIQVSVNEKTAAVMYVRINKTVRSCYFECNVFFVWQKITK